MKRGSGEFCNIKETHLSLTLITLCITLILIWKWKEKPLSVTLRSAQLDQMTSSSSSECNYVMGRWGADSRRPLYSGQCKYIERNWACRRSQRPDFSFEGYRWQPQNCEIPDFDRSAFLKRMQDKTIAFIGDSLSRQQFQSMMCMATVGGEEEESPDKVIDVANEYGFQLGKPEGNVHHGGSAYRFLKTNTTILQYWSVTLCDLEYRNLTNPSSSVATHLVCPTSFIRKYLPQFNVLVLNTGHHWKPTMQNARNVKVVSILKWLDSQLALHPKLKVFFRTISPRHFTNGDWNSGGSCNNLIPMTRGSEVVQNESSDPVVAALAGAVNGTKVKFLDITAISELRDEAHVSRYGDRPMDCLHWCLPGVPDTWNEILVAQI